jgi:hypothetical protein
LLLLLLNSSSCLSAEPTENSGGLTFCLHHPPVKAHGISMLRNDSEAVILANLLPRDGLQFRVWSSGGSSMKRLLWTVTVMLLGVGMALAQSGSSNNSDQQNGSLVPPSMENPPGAGHDQPYAGPTPPSSGTHSGSMSSNSDSSDTSSGNAESKSGNSTPSKQGSDEQSKTKTSNTTDTESTSKPDDSKSTPQN